MTDREYIEKVAILIICHNAHMAICNARNSIDAKISTDYTDETLKELEELK